jgi:hypothetical protein
MEQNKNTGKNGKTPLYIGVLNDFTRGQNGAVWGTKWSKTTPIITRAF